MLTHRTHSPEGGEVSVCVCALSTSVVSACWRHVAQYVLPKSVGVDLMSGGGPDVHMHRQFQGIAIETL
eukprot:1491604-Amphidinium_carterae.1